MLNKKILLQRKNLGNVKYFVGFSDNITYIIEDLNLGTKEVNKYKYTLNFNPKMCLPVECETIE